MSYDENYVINAINAATKEWVADLLAKAAARKAGEEGPTEDESYDYQNSYPVALAKLEGRSFKEVRVGTTGGYALVEDCGHDECEYAHMETYHEASQEFCCSDDPCRHYVAWLCLQHTPAT